MDFTRIDDKGVNWESVNPPCYKEAVIASRDFQGEEETRPQKGLGEVTYYYKSSNPKSGCPAGKLPVTKPIIILDGFDPNDDRSGAELYGKYLQYVSNNNKILLGDEIRSTLNPNSSFDVVILNFPRYKIGETQTTYNIFGLNRIISSDIYHNGGADFVERNAYILVELITKLNAEMKANGSTEQITIIGPSMGGLISRYALAYMEKNNLAHNTKLWISFDSPHSGANIPIGDQAFLNFFAEWAGDDGAKKNRDDKINSPAAKQFLLHHYLSNPSSPGGAPVFRDNFVNRLENNGINPGTNFGFPIQLRKVALINGNLKGITTGIGGQTILNFESRLRICNKLFGFFGPKIFCGNTIIVAQAVINFTGNYGANNRVFFGAYTNKHDETNTHDPSNTISYDISPGSTTDATNQIAIKIPSVTHSFGFITTSQNVGPVFPNHCFIPTKSSLAFKWNNKTNIGDFGENLSSKPLVCTGDIPFDSYFAPQVNEEHVFLSPEGANYALNEIRGIPQKPRINLSVTKSVNGSSCSNTSYTFSVPNLGAGITYNWQIPSGATITSGAGTNQITLTATNTGEVTVNITGNCGEFVVLPGYIDHVGQLYYPNDFTVTGPASSSLCPNSSYSFGATANVNKGTPLTYTWLVQNATIVSGQGTSQIQIQTGSSSSSSVAVLLLSISNSCGTGSSSPVVNSYNTRCGSFAMKAYPNPADQQMTITAISIPQTATKSTASTDAVQMQASDELSENDIIIHINNNVKIYDSNNKPVWSGKFENGKVNIPVNKMQNGFYYVKIEGENSVTKRIFIQH